MSKMNFLISLILSSVFILGSSYNKQIKTDNNSLTISFDEGWRFIKENPEGAEDPAFDDSEWRIIDLPHDWSIEDLPTGDKEKEVIGNWGFPDELKSWTWSGYERENMQVNVYTRCDQVRLELNGKNIGQQSIDKEKSITATFYVPYEAGILTARCFENGVETASETLKTVGAPASIRLTADRSVIKADRNDLAFIMAEVVDSDGNVIPWADEVTIDFEVNGKGKLAAVGNGNPGDMASFQQPGRKTYQGKCLAIIRPEVTPGKITIKATSEGLKECSLELTVSQ